MNDMLKVAVFENALKACGIKYEKSYAPDGGHTFGVLPNGGGDGNYDSDWAVFMFDKDGNYIKEE